MYNTQKKLLDFLKQQFLRIPRFFHHWRIYGFSVAFATLLFPFNRLFGRFKPFIAVHKHRAILLYLRKLYSIILDNFKKINLKTESYINPNSTIWTTWWDGEEAMPPLVKACYESIQKNSGSHPVTLITKYNYREYITLPEYIIDKVNSKTITITHFSNILRVNLLYEHGGIWMDVTILPLKDISLDNYSFYTLKAPAKKSVSVTLTRFTGILNKSARLNLKSHDEYQISRWSGFLLAGTKYSPIFEYLRDILYAYWKDHNDQIDYLLFDYTIALGYDNIPIIKKLIDNVPCSNVEKFELEKDLNSEYTDELIARHSLTTFHKLTWKKNFDMYTKENKLTLYGHLINTVS